VIVPDALPDVEVLRRLLASQLGLRFDDDRLELLSEVLAERTAASGAPSPDAYLARLASGDDEELDALAERLTVGETYFFRNANDIEAFARAALPDRIRARAGERRLRLLSAGCSSGEEPYTLAMLVRDEPRLSGWDVRVHGFDVNPTAVARARAGRYSSWSLRQTSPELRARFFEPAGREFRVVDDVKAIVALEQRNIVADDAALWPAHAYDVVFCRNVLMYLAPEAMRAVVARLASALVPGGYLFLGHAETLRGVSTEFHLRQAHGAFYYQSRVAGEQPPAALPWLTRPREAEGSAPAAPPPRRAAREGGPREGGRSGWYQTIRDSTERIAALARAPAAASAPPAAPAPGRLSAARVLGALELLERERFREALETLGAGPPEAERDVDALLLRAVLLATSGELERAEAVCARVFLLDELNAEAHYVRALCREHAGDPAGAAEHDRYAQYLDPTFAMPRLHLGLLARRGGDLDRARRELSRALALLAAEDGSRILLLGGGFTRSALVDLCRAELTACGGQP
jgi:chemotaxis protein methyltransferase CheR